MSNQNYIIHFILRTPYQPHRQHGMLARGAAIEHTHTDTECINLIKSNRIDEKIYQFEPNNERTGPAEAEFAGPQERGPREANAATRGVRKHGLHDVIERLRPDPD